VGHHGEDLCQLFMKLSPDGENVLGANNRCVCFALHLFLSTIQFNFFSGNKRTRGVGYTAGMPFLFEDILGLRKSAVFEDQWI
jgi:hypothetical protein